MTHFKTPLSIVIAALMLNGCAVGPDYQAPEYSVPQDWRITPAPASQEKPTSVWWQRVDDARLKSLIALALENNLEIKTANARVSEAKANVLLNGSSLLPQIDITGSAGRGTIGGFSGDSIQNNSQYGASGRFDLDVFGGNKRRLESALFSLDAQKAALSETKRSVLSELSRVYVRLYTARTQHEVTQKNITLQKETLALTKGQREEGMVSELDVSRAEAQLQTTKASLPPIETEMEALLQRLSVLTTKPPKELLELLDDKTIADANYEQVVFDTPIDIIRQRPDVQIAERQLAAANADIGAALSEFYPKLSLTAFIGRSQSKLFDHLKPWNFAGEALWPFLDFGRVRAGVDIADARAEQAFYNFQNTVLRAIEEIEVTHRTYLNEVERKKLLKLSSEQQIKAVMIAREQYKSGIGAQIDLLDAQRNALAAESEVVTSSGRVWETYIQLQSSLSGVEPVEAEDDSIENIAKLVTP